MTADRMYSLVRPLLLSQLLAVAWAVNRQINAQKNQRERVISLPDVLNIGSLFITIAFVILRPLVTSPNQKLSGAVLCSAYVLIGFYPLTVAAHHSLWSRTVVVQKIPLRYANTEELTLILFATGLAAAMGVWAGMHSSL